jgi:DNA-binding NarL/FixJ family response regulator
MNTFDAIPFPASGAGPGAAPVTRPISLVLVDDHPLAEDGVVARIRTEPGFQVLVASARIEDALQRVRETTPEVVLLNLRQEGADSLTLAGALHGEVPESRVIVMGMEARQTDVAGLIRAGVSGFIMASASFDQFIHAIHLVAEGVQVLPVELTHPLFHQLNRHGVRGRPRGALDIGRLTNRERQVADLIVQGLSNREIVARLQIALHTVKNHVHKILSKLAVNNRLEVAAFSRNRMAGSAASPPLAPESTAGP